MSSGGYTKLLAEVTASTQGIEDLLEDYGVYVSKEQAVFIRLYSLSLARDFEDAMTRGAANQLEVIVEDLQDLKNNTQQRLFEVKSLDDVRRDLGQD